MSESNDTDARKSETTVQRRDNWNDAEIRVLLDMWADDKIQELLESSGRNIVVYRGIADAGLTGCYCIVGGVVISSTQRMRTYQFPA